MNNLEEKDGDNYNKSKWLFPYSGEAVKSKLTFRFFGFFFFPSHVALGNLNFLTRIETMPLLWKPGVNLLGHQGSPLKGILKQTFLLPEKHN